MYLHLHRCLAGQGSSLRLQILINSFNPVSISVIQIFFNPQSKRIPASSALLKAIDLSIQACWIQGSCWLPAMSCQPVLGTDHRRHCLPILLFPVLPAPWQWWPVEQRSALHYARDQGPRGPSSSMLIGPRKGATHAFCGSAVPLEVSRSSVVAADKLSCHTGSQVCTIAAALRPQHPLPCWLGT